VPLNLVPHRDYYYQTEAAIFQKIRAGIPLTPLEQYTHCNCFPDIALLTHNCFDELYTRLYWQARPQFREEMIRIKGKGESRLHFEAMVYEELIKDWEKEIIKSNATDPLLKKSHEETNNELKQLAHEAIVKTLPQHEVDYRRYEIISWSKYRYISAKMIADILFTNNEYETTFDNGKVVLDVDGLMHIVSGHFAARAKLYTNSKSHFSQDFYHEDMPMQLQAIFTRIDASALYKGNLTGRNTKLVFEFRGIIYEIFFRRIGGNNRYRIKTFYPADDEKTVSIVGSHHRHDLGNGLALFMPF